MVREVKRRNSPPPKSLQDARKEGRGCKEQGDSQRFCASFYVSFNQGIYRCSRRGADYLFYRIYAQIPDAVVMYNGAGFRVRAMTLLVGEMVLRILLLIAPVLLVGLVVVVVCDIVQVKWHPTTKPLKPKFSKLNPIKGFQRFFPRILS